MSDVQRGGFTVDGLEIKCKDGDYILYADLVKIFAWMAEHRVEFDSCFLRWYKNGRWNNERFPDGDYIGAIVRLMKVA